MKTESKCLFEVHHECDGSTHLFMHREWDPKFRSFAVLCLKHRERIDDRWIEISENEYFVASILNE